MNDLQFPALLRQNFRVHRVIVVGSNEFRRSIHRFLVSTLGGIKKSLDLNLFPRVCSSLHISTRHHFDIINIVNQAGEN